MNFPACCTAFLEEFPQPYVLPNKSHLPHPNFNIQYNLDKTQIKNINPIKSKNMHPVGYFSKTKADGLFL